MMQLEIWSIELVLVMCYFLLECVEFLLTSDMIDIIKIGAVGQKICLCHNLLLFLVRETL